MSDITSVLVAAVAAFVTGFAYYAALGSRLARVSPAAPANDGMPAWKGAVELARCLVLAGVVAGLASRADVTTWAGGLGLGLALWVGFPLVLWTGAMLHERTPWPLAAIHAGDWLIKLVVVAVIVSVWP
jgi:hypothetical protein